MYNNYESYLNVEKDIYSTLHTPNRSRVVLREGKSYLIMEDMGDHWLLKDDFGDKQPYPKDTLAQSTPRSVTPSDRIPSNRSDESETRRRLYMASTGQWYH